jgi:hypothetical protein
MTYEGTLAYTLASDFLCRRSEVDKVHTGTCMIDDVSQLETRGDVGMLRSTQQPEGFPSLPAWGNQGSRIAREIL